MLPERVNMIISFTYDPHAAKESLIAMNPDMEITDEIVMDMIETWAEEDARGNDYILTDENGDEIG